MATITNTGKSGKTDYSDFSAEIANRIENDPDFRTDMKWFVNQTSATREMLRKRMIIKPLVTRKNSSILQNELRKEASGEEILNFFFEKNQRDKACFIKLTGSDCLLWHDKVRIFIATYHSAFVEQLNHLLFIKLDDEVVIVSVFIPSKIYPTLIYKYALNRPSPEEPELRWPPKDSADEKQFSRILIPKQR